MSELKSILALLGVAKPAEEAAKVAVSQLWAGDFKDAPRWFLEKYFTNDRGNPCGRMHVKLYADLGAIVTEGGRPVFTKTGRPQYLTTGYLAKLISKDIKQATGRDVQVHFKGYSLDPERYVLVNPWLQEEYEENERRHVPGLDEDETYEWNGQASLDKETWRWCAENMLRLLMLRQVMFFGLDDDFAKVMSAKDMVPASFNNELLALKHRMQDLMTTEAALFLMKHEWDDLAMYDHGDAIRTYRRLMRCVTGCEAGEPMFEHAWLLGKDPVEGYDWEGLWESISQRIIDNVPFEDTTVANAYFEILSNETEVEVIDWDIDEERELGSEDDESDGVPVGC